MHEKTHGILNCNMNSFDPERITYFAETDARGRDVPFGIRAKDRTRHVYVIGKSGMGKSTLLENMAVQDLKNSEGFAFIDPHGQSAEAIMHHIPQHRLDDVLYFNPSDISNPIAFNVLEGVEPDKRFLVVSGLMSVFKKIWVDAWSARMEYLLQYTLLALLEYPGSTLLGVNRMLSEKAYRDTVVASVTDPGVKAFWEDEYAKYSEKYAQEAGDAIKNKIGQFTSNPIIRNIIGQPHTSFDIRKFMDQRKILIVNLSKGLIGESNANLLGSMLTTRIYLAAMSRADLSAREMAAAPNFYFYVDEFQSFANATFANILSEARKYKLNLTIAHQYVDQMEEDVRNAVFGNVGTTITFRVGPLDAEVLEKLFMPEFTATDIVNLGFAQIYLTLMIDGIGSPPFSAKTLPPIKEPDTTYYDVVRARSREQFGSPRAEVETKIGAFYAQEFVDNSPRKEKGGKFGAGSRGGSDGDRGSFTRSSTAPSRAPYTPTVATPVPEAPQHHKEDLRVLLQGITDRAAPQVHEPKVVIAEAPALQHEPAVPQQTIEHAEKTATISEVSTVSSHALLDEQEVTTAWVPTVSATSERRPQREDRPRHDTRRERDTAHTPKRHESRPRQERSPERAVERPMAKPSSDLKSALAAALAGVTTPSVVQGGEVFEKQAAPAGSDASTPRETKPHRVVVSLDDKQPAPAPAVPMGHIDTARIRAHLEERAEAIAHPAKAPHEITPQALAHMMRITLKDKKKRPSA